MMKLIFNLWNEIVHTEKKFIKSKIIKISAYFRDFDAINSQFSDFLNQSKIEFNNLNQDYILVQFVNLFVNKI